MAVEINFQVRSFTRGFRRKDKEPLIIKEQVTVKRTLTQKSINQQEILFSWQPEGLPTCAPYFSSFCSITFCGSVEQNKCSQDHIKSEARFLYCFSVEYLL
jgi:hypothetical protein